MHSALGCSAVLVCVCTDRCPQVLVAARSERSRDEVWQVRRVTTSACSDSSARSAPHPVAITTETVIDARNFTSTARYPCSPFCLPQLGAAGPARIYAFAFLPARLQKAQSCLAPQGNVLNLLHSALWKSCQSVFWHSLEQ